MGEREARAERAHADPARVAALEHLTGPWRGKVTWLGEPILDISFDRQGRVTAAAPEPDAPAEDAVARLRWTGAGHLIEPLGDNPLWVNRRSVKSAPLRDHDMVEFCERGPISRYFLYVDGHRIHQTVAGIFADAGGYLRASRKPLPRRLAVAAGQVLQRLGRETTILFRAGVLLALVALAAFVYQQSRINALLRSQIEGGTARLEDVSQILARTRDEAITPGQLESLRHELATRVTTTAERVSELERLSGTSARVIEQSAAAVAFLQGAYGFRELGAERMLRYVVNDAGQALVLPNGLPLLSLDGEGPVAQRQFTGTGFLLKDSGLMVTNRHVGAPWEHDATFGLFEREGVEPVMTRFVAYLPGVAEPADVEIVRQSDDADVAILGYEAAPGQSAGLELSDRRPRPGDRVIVLGYPTGLKSIIAQAGEAFVEELQASGETDFWKIAERLSAEKRIVPLASQGIVGRVSEETIVYDAATTSGGSGGPVLDTEGAVIAVNTAIIPEYGGSNLGIPVTPLRELLTEAAQ